MDTLGTTIAAMSPLSPPGSSNALINKILPPLPRKGGLGEDEMLEAPATPQGTAAMRSYTTPICTRSNHRASSRLSISPLMMLFKRDTSAKQPSYVPWSQRNQQPVSEAVTLPNLRYSPPYELSSSGPPPIMAWPPYDHPSVHTPPATPNSNTWSLFRSGSIRLLPSPRSSEDSDGQSTRIRRLSFFRSTALPSAPKKKLEISHPLAVESCKPHSPTTPGAPSRPPRPVSLYPIFDTPTSHPRPDIQEDPSTDAPLIQVVHHLGTLSLDAAHPTDSSNSLSSHTSSSSFELAQQYAEVGPGNSLDDHVEHEARVARHRRRAFHALDGERKTRTKRISESEKEAARRAGMIITTRINDHRADVSPSQSEKDLIIYAERMRGDSRGFAKSADVPSPRLAVVEEEDFVDEDEAQTSKDVRNDQADSSLHSWRVSRQTRDVAPRAPGGYQSWLESRPQFNHQPLDFSPVRYNDDGAPVQHTRDQLPAPSSAHQQGQAIVHKFKPSQSPTTGSRSSQGNTDHDKAVAFKRSLDEETERRKQKYDKQGQSQDRSNRYHKQLRRLENGRSQLTSTNSTPKQPQSPSKPSWSSNSAASDFSPASPSPLTRQPSKALRVLGLSTEEEEASIAEQRAITRGRLLVKDEVYKQRYRFSRWEKEQESFEERLSTVLGDEPRPNAAIARQMLDQQTSSSWKSSRPMPGHADDSSTPAPTTEQEALHPLPLRLRSKKHKQLPALPIPPASARRAQLGPETTQRRIEIQQQGASPNPEPLITLPLPPRTTSLPAAHQRRRRESGDSANFWSDESASVYSQEGRDDGSLPSADSNRLGQDASVDAEEEIIDLYSSATPASSIDAATAIAQLDDLAKHRRRRGHHQKHHHERGDETRREEDERDRQEEVWKREAERRVEAIRKNLRVSVVSQRNL